MALVPPTSISYRGEGSAYVAIGRGGKKPSKPWEMPNFTSTGTSHAHVIWRYYFLLDREVVCLQGVRLDWVTQDDRGIVVLVLEGQELFRADGMEGLVGLRDEAGLRELRGRHTLCMLDAITCRQNRSVRKQPKHKQFKETRALLSPPSLSHSTVRFEVCSARGDCLRIENTWKN